MTRGRKKLPQQILDLRGTARNDRRRDLEVVGAKITRYDVSCWTIPGYEVLTPRAKAIYSRACRQQIALGLLESSYLPQLVAYAQQYDLYLTLAEEVQEEGTSVTTDKGIFPNPKVKMMTSVLTQIKSIGSNFGMSPVDRQKIHLETGGKGKNIRSIIMEFDSDEADEQDTE